MHDESNPLADLDLDIQVSLYEIKELTVAVKDADELYMADESDNNRLFLETTIERYKKVVDRTKIQLEAYFQEERELGIPTDFSYRRLYNKLKDAY